MRKETGFAPNKAVGVRFELTVPFRIHLLSKQAL